MELTGPLVDDDYVLQMTTLLTWKTNRQSTPVLPTLNPRT